MDRNGIGMAGNSQPPKVAMATRPDFGWSMVGPNLVETRPDFVGTRPDAGNATPKLVKQGRGLPKVGRSNPWNSQERGGSERQRSRNGEGATHSLKLRRAVELWVCQRGRSTRGRSRYREGSSSPARCSRRRNFARTRALRARISTRDTPFVLARMGRPIVEVLSRCVGYRSCPRASASSPKCLRASTHGCSRRDPNLERQWSGEVPVARSSGRPRAPGIGIVTPRTTRADSASQDHGGSDAEAKMGTELDSLRARYAALEAEHRDLQLQAMFGRVWGAAPLLPGRPIPSGRTPAGHTHAHARSVAQSAMNSATTT